MGWKPIGLIAVLTLARGSTGDPISATCRDKVAQVLCSMYHHDRLRMCLNGVTEGAVFLNQEIESYCFTHEADKCVTQKLCTVVINQVTEGSTKVNRINVLCILYAFLITQLGNFSFGFFLRCQTALPTHRTKDNKPMMHYK